jgi:hypothetical protein
MSVFIDLHSDMTYLYYCKTMDEFLQKCLKPFFYEVINPTKHKVKLFHYLQTDDASLYTTPQVKKFLGDKGCAHRKSAPHHLIQNRRVEKAIEYIDVTATALMIESACPKFLWQTASDYASDSRNDGLTKRHESLSPTEQATKEKPTLKGRYPFYWPAYLKDTIILDRNNVIY